MWAAALSLWGVVPHHRHGQVTIEIVLQRGPLARMTFCGFWCWKNVVIHFSNSRCQHRSTRLCKGHVVHRHHSTSTCNHLSELEKSQDCVSSSALSCHHIYLPRIILWLMWVTGLDYGPCWLVFQAGCLQCYNVMATKAVGNFLWGETEKTFFMIYQPFGRNLGQPPTCPGFSRIKWTFET